MTNFHCCWLIQNSLVATHYRTLPFTSLPPLQEELGSSTCLRHTQFQLIWITWCRPVSWLIYLPPCFLLFRKTVQCVLGYTQFQFMTNLQVFIVTCIVSYYMYMENVNMLVNFFHSGSVFPDQEEHHFLVYTYFPGKSRTNIDLVRTNLVPKVYTQLWNYESTCLW